MDAAADRPGRGVGTPIAEPPDADRRPFGPAGRSRLFVSDRRASRTRRASDVLVLAECAFGIVAFGVVARPPAAIESSLIRLFAAFPNFLNGIWRLGWTLMVVWAVILVLAAIVRGRVAALRDVVSALLVGSGVEILTAHAIGVHVSFGAALRATGAPVQIPSLRLALATAAIIAIRPYLTRPFRRVGRWTIAFGAFASMLLGVTTPSGMMLALFVGAGAAAVVHLVFGSVAGRPSLEQVRVALEQMGVRGTELEPAARQSSGVFEVRGLDGASDLVVKIYGRDAYDSQVVAKAWRALWYRDSDATFTLTRLQQVEHEAFLLLRAAQQGVRVPTVVTAGKTPDNDALLVLHVEGMALQDVPADRISVALLEDAWQAVALLHDAGIVHGNLDGQRLAVTDAGDVVVGDLTSARVATAVDGRRSDFAQLFVVTALALDETKAVEIATSAIGREEFIAALPYVQDAALGSELRRAAKAAAVDIDALRTRVAASVDVELAAPVRLRRVTRKGIVGALLLAVAAYALLSSLSGLDLRELADQLRDAAWGWLVLGLVVGQTPRLTQAASTRAASPKPIPFGPIAVLQLAISFVNLAVPSSVGRVAVSVRFFQRQGLRAATALSIGALDSVAGFIVQITVLLLAFATGFGALDLEFNRSSDSGGHRIVIALVVVVLLAVATVACIPRWRRAGVNAIRDAATQVRETVASLTLTQVSRLLLANAATEILFALTLGIMLEAFGTTVPIATLLVVNVSAALLAGIMPVPGGIGVAEGALIAGLVAAGVNETVAFTGVISYRLATFYLPPIWGAFAFRWLERNRYL